MGRYCESHGYGHPEAPPCPPDVERRRGVKACSGCGSHWCDRVARAVSGLTPPPCPVADEKRRAG